MNFLYFHAGSVGAVKKYCGDSRPIRDLVLRTLEQLVSSIWRRKTAKIAQYQLKYVRELVQKKVPLSAEPDMNLLVLNYSQGLACGIIESCPFASHQTN